MKYRIYAISLLFVLILNIFRSQLPYIEYSLFKSYITNNLCVEKDKPRSCCQGKCHLAKQIKIVNDTESSDNTSSSSTAPRLTKFQDIKDFISSELHISSTSEFVVLLHSEFKMIVFTQIISSIFIPPKV